MPILLLCLTACGDPSVPRQTIDSAATPKGSSQTALAHSFKITSEYTKQIHSINVWTPPNMGEDGAKHPVLYLIDGGLDQDFHHISGLAQLSTINGQFQTPIVVGIETSNRYYQLTPTMTDSRYLPWNGPEDAPEMGGADDFHHYITDEVIPLIEAKYPTSERKIIMGESLAGYYVTREFLHFPNNFTDYVAISPSLWLDDQKLAKESALHLAKHDNLPRNLYLTMADEGGTMQAGLDKVLAAITSQNHKSTNLIYVDRRNTETHSTIYHMAALDALIQLLGLPAPDYGPTPWYLREGGRPDDDKSQSEN